MNCPVCGQRLVDVPGLPPLCWYQLRWWRASWRDLDAAEAQGRLHVGQAVLAQMERRRRRGVATATPPLEPPASDTN